MPESYLLMKTDRIEPPQNQSVSNWHKERHRERVHSQTLKCVPTNVICINNFAESGMTAVKFVNIPFSIPKGRFLLLNPLLDAGGRLESINIELRCFEKAWKSQRF